jgi:hypothetical protein
MKRVAVVDSAEQESSSRTFIVGVLLFLALRAIVRIWSEVPAELDEAPEASGPPPEEEAEIVEQR